MSKKIIFFIAAGFFAILAVVATNIYLTQQAQEVKEKAKQEVARQQAMQAAVVIAKQDIPQGVTIEPGMVDTKIIVRDYIQPNAAQYPERIVGMKTLVPISQDEQITLTKLTSPKEVATKTSLATATPIGKRAISIPVDNQSSIMGLIKPGDYVDVLATVPVPVLDTSGKQVVQPAVVSLFQNVLVLTVNTNMGTNVGSDSGRYQQESSSGSGPSLITLALSPQEANLLAFVQEQGRVRLSLRSPADSRIEPLQVANWENLFTYLLPPEMREKAMAESQKKGSSAETTVEKPRYREIEIYRGLKKESIPVTGQ